jgi:BirA family biotin operon repressor/biotin-[acetyl-CoA-carboxylase] ligase
MNVVSRVALDAHECQDALAVRLPDVDVTVLSEVGSTNTWLLERCRSICSVGVVDSMHRATSDEMLVLALHQTAGRGRHGKVWVSEPGSSLTFSVSRRMDREDLSGLSLAVGVLLAEFLDQLPGKQGTRQESPTSGKILLKWPNDLVAGEADPAGWFQKLGGILVETSGAGSRRMVVVGVGVNLGAGAGAGAGAGGMPCSYGFTSLEELGRPLDLVLDLPVMIESLFSGLREFDKSGFSAFRERFSGRNALLGLDVQTTPDEEQGGRVMGVSANGALLIRHADPARPWSDVSAGEISVRPVLSGFQRSRQS